MKFKFKVLIINILLLSITLFLAGFFLVQNTFRHSLNTITTNAITENNLAQSSVEYALLDIIGDPKINIEKELTAVGSRVETSMISSETNLLINYDGNYIYDSLNTSALIPNDLFSDKEPGSKYYIYSKEDEKHYIYVSSCSFINQTPLLVITKKNLDSIYSMTHSQISFFRIMSLLILFLGGLIMYFFSNLLTKPMVRLNEISDKMADGDYKVRASVNSQDEIGQLAAKFNFMALSVDNKVSDLEDELKRREQFVADFTHEIKTPMTSIIGYADTMRSMDLTKEEELTFLNYIYSSGKRLEIMSGKLFDLIYLNRNDIDCTLCRTYTIIEELEALTRPALHDKNITLKSNVEDCHIKINKDLLLSALINFIDNARKASSENSTIDVSGASDDDKYIFTIRDYGIGMKEEYLDKICDEFFMIDKSRSRSEGSSGLGLSLAALIIKKHNGTLSIASKEGEGTTITVVLKKNFEDTKEGSQNEEQ